MSLFFYLFLFINVVFNNVETDFQDTAVLNKMKKSAAEKESVEKDIRRLKDDERMRNSNTKFQIN